MQSLDESEAKKLANLQAEYDSMKECNEAEDERMKTLHNIKLAQEKEDHFKKREADH
jgi:hypothetical protein